MPDYIPALQARMGDWRYYVTVMKLGKIARECRLAEEIHANKDLDELIKISNNFGVQAMNLMPTILL